MTVASIIAVAAFSLVDEATSDKGEIVRAGAEQARDASAQLMAAANELSRTALELRERTASSPAPRTPPGCLSGPRLSDSTAG
jgi:hypothetical protein